MQKALIIPTLKSPFEMAQVPIPVPGKGEALVKILSVGLNPMDALRQRLDHLIEGYPAIMGSDIAGVVQQVGEGVKWKVGDEVMVHSIFGGGYQQHAVFPADFLIRKPSNISFDEAATIPCTFVTSCVGLYAPAPIGAGLNPEIAFNKPQAGKSALVIGAGTSCGQFAIQLLRFAGLKNIIAYASGKHETYLVSLGATEVIDRAATPLSALPTHDATRAHQFDVVFDAALILPPANGEPTPIDVAYTVVRPDGKIVTVNPGAAVAENTKNIEIVNVLAWLFGPDVYQPKTVMPEYSATTAYTEFGRKIVEALPRMIECGEVVGNRVEVLKGGLEGALKGLYRWEEGGVSGVKLVAHPQE